MIFQEHGTHLAHLVRLRIAPLVLEVDFLLDSCLAKDVMTPPNPHLKPKPLEQLAQVVKPNACIMMFR